MQCLSKPPRIRQPITFEIMEGIQSVLLKQPHGYYNLMMWAACCIAFFGLLRVSEFTTSSVTQFNPSKDLSLSDIALDSRASTQLIRITLKQSKTDQLRQGTHIFWEKLTIMSVQLRQ